MSRELRGASKSKVHIRGVLSLLWDFAMWRGDVPTERNPMELVTIKGATVVEKMVSAVGIEPTTY